MDRPKLHATDLLMRRHKMQPQNCRYPGIPLEGKFPLDLFGIPLNDILLGIFSFCTTRQISERVQWKLSENTNKMVFTALGSSPDHLRESRGQCFTRYYQDKNFDSLIISVISSNKLARILVKKCSSGVYIRLSLSWAKWPFQSRYTMWSTFSIFLGSGWKHCGKINKCWYPAFSFFPHNVFRRLLANVVESQHCTVKG